MESDKRATKLPEESSLCTHHVGSGRKEEQGILGSGNTARPATWLRSLNAPIWNQQSEKHFDMYSFFLTQENKA